MKKPSVLFIDDDESLCRVTRHNLTKIGFSIECATDGQTGIERFKHGHFDVVLTDIQMSGTSGMTVIREVKALDPEAIVLVVTAYGTIDNAVEAVKAGAVDYITKPFSREELRFRIERALKVRRLQEENMALRMERDAHLGFEGIIGNSAAMKELFRMARKVATSEATVLILGESGTGKELIAKAIHCASPRCDGPFIPVNCGAMPDTLLESELFGHEKGAFTGAIARKLGRFELADKGTIFLDEIGDMPPALQVKLLRVLQDRRFERVGGTKTIEVDVRIIAATNQNLERLMEEGKFREDLYYRLNVITIFVPPLRERPEDIPLLAEHFLRKYRTETNKRITGFSQETMDILMSYNWPGNVRELENAVEHAVVLAKSQIIQPDDLPFNLKSHEPEVPARITTLEEAQKEFKKRLIMRVLQQTGGNRTKAARILNIQRTYLSRLIKELEIKA